MTPVPRSRPVRRANRPPGGPGTRRRVVEAVVSLAIVALLGATALEQLMMVPARARTTATRTVRAGFEMGVQLAHLSWRVRGGERAGRVGLGDGRTVRVNVAGWPTLDPRDPAQDSARELHELLVGPLGPGWELAEQPEPGAGRARFRLRGPGGGEFRYDARIGHVSRPGTGP